MNPASSLNKRNIFLLGTLVSVIYLSYLPATLFPGDSGDFLSAIATRGIPHPPGYPLYTSLGIAFSQLPFGSLITKIGLLSVLPAIAAIVFLYDILCVLTGKRAAPFIASLSLAFVYPFWLYSEVVEVFSFNTAFIVILLWLLVRWFLEGHKRYALAAAFVFGLSLSHHLIILFLLPAIVYFLILRPIPKSLILPCIVLVLAGLLPYAYLPIAAHLQPAINWMGPPAWKHFISVVTREGYGTFRSASQIGHEPVLRAANLYAFFALLLEDFRIFGSLLIVAGLWRIIRTGSRWLLIVLALAAGAYLFFLFYASFPLVNDFLLGTFERFILPLYIFLTIPLTFGLVQISEWIAGLVPRRRLSLWVMAVLALYPIGLFLLNQPKLRDVQFDQSAQLLGHDILRSVPREGVVLLSMDIPLFSTQYVYYGLGDRSDVKLIHFFKLWQPVHRESILHEFPDLSIPHSYDNPDIFMKEFLDNNSTTAPIVSSVPFVISGGTWVPWGLLYRFVPQSSPLPVETVITENARLWSQFQSPWSANQRKTKPLLTTEIATVYAQARTEAGFYLATQGKPQEAKTHLLGALEWEEKNTDALLTLSQVNIQLKRCNDALSQLETLKTTTPDDPAVYYAFYLTYTQCSPDAQKAKEYHQLYEQKTKQSETNVKEL